MVQEAFHEQRDIMKDELDHWKVEFSQQKRKVTELEQELKGARARIANLEKQVEEAHESRDTVFRKYYEVKTQQEKLKQFKTSVVGLLDNEGISSSLGARDSNGTESPLKSSPQEGRHHLRSTLSNSPTQRSSPIRRASPGNGRSPLSTSRNLTTPERKTPSRYNDIGSRSYDDDLTVSGLLSRTRLSPRVPKSTPSPTARRNISPASSYLLIDRDIPSFSLDRSPSTDKRSMSTGEDALEAENLYRRVKSKLTPDQFKQFAVNIKLLNTNTQTSTETLRNLEVVFKNEQELFHELRKLIQKNGEY